MQALYETSATATGGRDGRAVSDDERLNVALSIPKGLGGPGGEGTNPEQLFAAGYSACFLSALKYMAMKRSVKVPDDTSVTAHVKIGPVAQDRFGLEVELTISIPGVDRAVAEELVDLADQGCPYSNGLRNNVPVTLTIA
jgi:lipoyl-dependent peroxiredoxin